MPTLSPTLMVLVSAPGPSLTTLPTPSWPPTCPAWVGCGRMAQLLVMTPKSEWQTPECVLGGTSVFGANAATDRVLTS